MPSHQYILFDDICKFSTITQDIFDRNSFELKHLGIEILNCVWVVRTITLTIQVFTSFAPLLVLLILYI